MRHSIEPPDPVEAHLNYTDRERWTDARAALPPPGEPVMVLYEDGGRAQAGSAIYDYELKTWQSAKDPDMESRIVRYWRVIDAPRGG